MIDKARALIKAGTPDDFEAIEHPQDIRGELIVTWKYNDVPVCMMILNKVGTNMLIADVYIFAIRASCETVEQYARALHYVAEVAKKIEEIQ